MQLHIVCYCGSYATPLLRRRETCYAPRWQPLVKNETWQLKHQIQPLQHMQLISFVLLSIMDVIHDKYIAAREEHHLWFPKRDDINSIAKWLETLLDDKGIQLHDPFDQLLIWMAYIQSKVKTEKHYVFTMLMAYMKSRYGTGFWWWSSTRYKYSTIIYIVTNKDNFAI
jgi:hypothetical protein